MIWEFPRSVNPGKLPLITVLVGVRNFIRFGLERHKEYVMSPAISVLIDVIYHPAVKKKNKAIKRKIFHLITTLRFFKIRIKKKWPLSPEKCCSEGWNTHPKVNSWLGYSQYCVNYIFVSSSVKMTSGSNTERER